MLVAATFFLNVGVMETTSMLLSLNDLLDIVDEADDIEFVVEANEHCCKNSSISSGAGGGIRDIM